MTTLVGEAHYKTIQAIAKGKLKRPCVCSECGRTKRVIAHHPDYDKPLEVVWLCHSCHRYAHLPSNPPNHHTMPKVKAEVQTKLIITIDTTKLKTMCEASVILNKPLTTIYEWVISRRILSAWLGDYKFIPQNEIDRILKADTPITKAMVDGEV